MTNLQKLKKAIITEIPEFDISFMGENYEHTIRLADVLRVLDIMDRIVVLESLLSDNKTKWNLSKNNLDLQSKPTIDLLTDLICIKQ